ncbi:hypothetical protein [Providencia stuartii]|uniref:hypothetical protein n=1 Tax=Providencia stuartii TaxID=588 RepID=UPI002941081C|nr:hypothetical protein [Providencia stuartii]ELR5041655.1 hypothetical protein [Providencia stuartii]ELR5081574.1 hypothetical protein [Providencia stuartii]ELR5083231.1 hypothetical protein [Providencia stuartii]
MKVEYVISGTGNFAKVMIFSFITERRKLNHIVDVVKLWTPVLESSTGFFFRITTIYGKPDDVLRAYKIISKEANK